MFWNDEQERRASCYADEVKQKLEHLFTTENVPAIVDTKTHSTTLIRILHKGTGKNVGGYSFSGERPHTARTGKRKKAQQRKGVVYINILDFVLLRDGKKGNRLVKERKDGFPVEEVAKEIFENVKVRVVLLEAMEAESEFRQAVNDKLGKHVDPHHAGVLRQRFFGALIQAIPGIAWDGSAAEATVKLQIELSVSLDKLDKLIEQLNRLEDTL